MKLSSFNRSSICKYSWFTMLALGAFVWLAACTSRDDYQGGDTSSWDDSASGQPLCQEEDFLVLHSQVSLMFLQDISGSMQHNSKWDISQTALATIFDTWDGPEFRFGYDLFPPIVANTYSPHPLEYCDTTPAQPYEGDTGVTIDCDPYNQDVILDLQSQIVPDEETPLWCAMNNFLQESYAPNLFTEGIPAFLVVISDGADSCGDKCTGGFGDTDPNPVTSADFESLTINLNQEMNLTTYVVGFGNEVDTEVLATIAQNGGAPDQFQEYLRADNLDSLTAAFDHIIGSVLSCELQVSDKNPSYDPSKINVYFSSLAEDIEPDVIFFDPGCKDGSGWTWMDDQFTALKLCDQPCAALEGSQGTLKVTATFGCDPPEVPH